MLFHNKCTFEMVADYEWADVMLKKSILLAATLLTGLMAAWFRRRLGGWTGDTLGAVQQATELAILLAAAWHAA